MKSLSASVDAGCSCEFTNVELFGIVTVQQTTGFPVMPVALPVWIQQVVHPKFLLSLGAQGRDGRVVGCQW